MSDKEKDISNYLALLQKHYETLKQQELEPEDYVFVFSRASWEALIKGGLFHFTKEDLDKAESTKDGFIGKEQGLVCYLSSFPVTI